MKLTAVISESFTCALDKLEHEPALDSKVVRAVAHSASSEVFKVISEQLDRMAKRDICVRVVFTSLKKKEAEEVFALFAAAYGMNEATASVRTTQFAASEAHEQLMVGGRALWIGDEKETVSSDKTIALQIVDSELAGFGKRCFDQVWDLSGPLPPSMANRFAKLRYERNGQESPGRPTI